MPELYISFSSLSVLVEVTRIGVVHCETIFACSSESLKNIYTCVLDSADSLILKLAW